MPRKKALVATRVPNAKRTHEDSDDESANQVEDEHEFDEEEAHLGMAMSSDEAVAPTQLGARSKDAALPDLDFNVGGEGYVLKPTSSSDQAQQLQGFTKWEGETEEELIARLRSYVVVKRRLDEDVERIQKSVLSDVCNSLKTFINDIQLDDPREDTIPTAILVTGYNLGDRAAMHEEIWKVVAKSDPLARVEPTHCTNLKRLVKHVLCSFIGEREEAKSFVRKQWKLSKLAEWLRSRPSAQKPERLLVFFDEVQSCNPGVLQDFIEICRLHQKDLRFIFLISLHGSVQALRELLPRSTMDHLRIEPFKLEPSVPWLKRIVSEVLVAGRLPVRISGAVLRDINCNFHLWNLSVWRFVRCLHLLVLDYFSRPLSVYCLPPDIYVAKRSPHHVKYAIKFFDSVADLTPMELNQQWDTLLANLRRYHGRFPALFRIYHSLLARPNEPSTLEHNIYAACLLTNKEHIGARAAQLPPALFQVWPDADERRVVHRSPFELTRLVSLADAWVAELGNLPADEPEKTRLITELTALHERLVEEMHTPLSPSANATGSAAMRTLRDSGSSTASARLQREQALAASMRSDDFAVPRASQARRALREWLQRLFDELLPAPDAFPLYELFYDTKLSLLHLLYPEMDRMLESGLSSPATLLGCPCCKSHDVTASSPDVCILFALMRKERTRELNLHDWLESFRAVVRSRGETEQQEQARFFQAVDSLQLLGYVRKGNTRKPDHIIRCDL